VTHTRRHSTRYNPPRVTNYTVELGDGPEGVRTEASRGMREPWPTALPTQIAPPCSSTRRLVSASPSPMPSAFRLLSLPSCLSPLDPPQETGTDSQTLALRYGRRARASGASRSVNSVTAPDKKEKNRLLALQCNERTLSRHRVQNEIGLGLEDGRLPSDRTPRGSSQCPRRPNYDHATRDARVGSTNAPANRLRGNLRPAHRR
jgi:hypothetical protein